MAGSAAPAVTDLLIAWRQGETRALDELLPAVYRQLKRIAARYVRGRPGRSLDTTSLVHEAYLRLIDLDRIDWQDRNHFFAVSARLMRRVLVDEARRAQRMKRGGGALVLSLDEERHGAGGRSHELLAIDDALRDLGAAEPAMARIVELRYFGGLNRDEIAEVMGLSSATVTRRWRTARAWLGRHLTQTAGADDRVDVS